MPGVVLGEHGKVRYTRVFLWIRIGVKSEGSFRDAYARLLRDAVRNVAAKLHIQVQLLNSPLADANAANMRRSKTMATAGAALTERVERS